jgi:RNA polymerase sigma-70 factor (ECF subfamily)
VDRSLTFDRLYEAYYNDVYQYVFYSVSHRAQAEDLTQEVFIRALLAYDRFRGESTEKTWLFAIARRAVIDWYRKKRKEVLFDFTAWKQLPSHEALPDELAEAKDDTVALYKGIRQLKPNYRDVIILRSIQDLSIKETADIMGWSVTKVKVTHHRAIKKLKEIVGPEFSAYTDQEVRSP